MAVCAQGETKGERWRKREREGEAWRMQVRSAEVEAMYVLYCAVVTDSLSLTVIHSPKPMLSFHSILTTDCH